MMKRRTINEMIEAKDRIERGEVTPARVWKLHLGSDGRVTRRTLNARAFQRAQKRAWEKVKR